MSAVSKLVSMQGYDCQVAYTPPSIVNWEQSQPTLAEAQPGTGFAVEMTCAQLALLHLV